MGQVQSFKDFHHDLSQCRRCSGVFCAHGKIGTSRDVLLDVESLRVVRGSLKAVNTSLTPVAPSFL